MARCPRCNCCESQWKASPCKVCGFPAAKDSRTILQLLKHLQADINEEIDGGEECFARDVMLTAWLQTIDTAISKIKEPTHET